MSERSLLDLKVKDSLYCSVHRVFGNLQRHIDCHRDMRCCHSALSTKDCPANLTRMKEAKVLCLSPKGGIDSELLQEVHAAM